MTKAKQHRSTDDQGRVYVWSLKGREVFVDVYEIGTAEEALLEWAFPRVAGSLQINARFWQREAEFQLEESL